VNGRKSLVVPREREFAPTPRPQAARRAAELMGVLKEHRGE